MNREIVFQQRAWEDYLFWQSHDKKMLRRVNRIIQEISRNPFEGIGKPNFLNTKNKDIGAEGSTTATASFTASITAKYKSYNAAPITIADV